MLPLLMMKNKVTSSFVEIPDPFFRNLSVSQELICLRAIQDVNVPKFLQDDLTLFNGIVSDLFPKTKQEPIDYGALEESMRSVCTKKNLKDVDGECFWKYIESLLFRYACVLR